jgi:hypothetical protein
VPSKFRMTRETMLESSDTQARTNVFTQVASFRSHVEALDVRFDSFDIGNRYDRIRCLSDPLSHVITQSDLADRALTIELPAIADTDRRDEAALRKAFALARSRIFGALLDALVHGLRHRSNTSPQSLPRLADFALWATACEGAFARQ